MFSKKIFLDENLQSGFEKSGYVRFPFLEDHEIRELKSYYEQNPSVFKEGFHPTMFHPSVEYRKKMDKKIREITQPKLDSFIKGYYALYGNFMLKEPGEQSAMRLHQDWTYVDETRETSLAIWFPLQDLNDQNGVLQMIPGSHKIDNIIRGPGIFEPYYEQMDYLREHYLESVYLKAGEAIVWDHKVLHCSPPNLSNERRISATAILVPEGEEVYHFYQAPEHDNKKIEKFLVDNDFYMGYEINKKPQHAKSLGYIHYEFPSLSLKNIQLLLNIE